jgi:hypothetical protein
MTAKQWRKIELRIRNVMRHSKMVTMVLWEDPNGDMHLQVVNSQIEHIPGDGFSEDPPRRTSI